MEKEAVKKSLFITFEGTEGTGKSTQARMLVSALRKKGYKALYVKDPGTTKLGLNIRKILLHSKKDISPCAETMLYMAARAQLVEEKILPALKKNIIVVCDRFLDATICYQGYGLGVDIKLIEKLNSFVTKARMPDITFLLESDVKAGLKRSLKVKGFSDRIEKRSYNFHNRVKNGYLKQLKKHPQRIKKISIDKNNKQKTREIIIKTIYERFRV